MVEKAAAMEPTVLKTIQTEKAKLVANLLAAQKEHDDFMSSLRTMVDDVDTPKKSAKSATKSTAKSGERCAKQLPHAAHNGCIGRERRKRGTA